MSKFFFANWNRDLQKVFNETRRKYVRLFGGKQDDKRTDSSVYCRRIVDSFDEWINSLIYNCCDGRVADMKALEKSSFMDFCQTLDLFIEKVDQRNKEIKEIKTTNKINS